MNSRLVKPEAYLEQVLSLRKRIHKYFWKIYRNIWLCDHSAKTLSGVLEGSGKSEDASSLCCINFVIVLSLSKRWLFNIGKLESFVSSVDEDKNKCLTLPLPKPKKIPVE